MVMKNEASNLYQFYIGNPGFFARDFRDKSHRVYVSSALTLMSVHETARNGIEAILIKPEDAEGLKHIATIRCINPRLYKA